MLNQSYERSGIKQCRSAIHPITNFTQSSIVLINIYTQSAGLLPVRSVGVMGDERTYQKVVAIRAVTTEDFMTADWARLPYDLLARVSTRITNEVPGINRILYDCTSKPPSTIEFE